MPSIIDVVASRVSRDLVKTKLAETFSERPTVVNGVVLGKQLAMINGTPTTTTLDDDGLAQTVVGFNNIGRPAMAMWAPSNGGVTAVLGGSSSSGTTTISEADHSLVTLRSPSGLEFESPIGQTGLSIADSLAGAGLVIADKILAVGAGLGITVNADDVALASSVAGAGLAYSAGVLNIGAGLGITVNANDIALASSVAGAGLAYSTGVLNIGAGLGITVNANDVALASSVAGAGLAYDTGVLNIGAGLGITVNANDVALTTPGTLTANTTNSSTGSHTHAITANVAASTLTVNSTGTVGTSAALARADHTHAITSSPNPGAAASILASDATGKLTLPLMVASTSLTTPLVTAGAGQSLTLQAPLDLILDPTSDLVRMGAGASLQASSYASQTTGWRVTDAGEADFRYIFVDEMHAKSFIADLEQALAGGQIIAKSVAMVATAFTLPAAGATGTLRVKDLPSAPNMAVFQSGDFVGLRLFSRAGGSLTIGWAWGTVTAYADGTGGNEGTQTWTFTRHATTPGAATGTIPADALALDFGVSGNGFYEVNAIDGAYGANSPYAQVVTWATHPATQTVRARMGNLRGIFSVADEFGLYAGSGTAVTDRYIRASNSALELRNVPPGALRWQRQHIPAQRRRQQQFSLPGDGQPASHRPAGQ
jgi:hypothetical protein